MAGAGAGAEVGAEAEAGAGAGAEIETEKKIGVSEKESGQNTGTMKGVQNLMGTEIGTGRGIGIGIGIETEAEEVMEIRIDVKDKTIQGIGPMKGTKKRNIQREVGQGLQIIMRKTFLATRRLIATDEHRAATGRFLYKAQRL